MAHLKKEDTGVLGILQASSGNGEDPIKSLLRHTIQQVLKEELTAFLNAEPRRGRRSVAVTETGINLERSRHELVAWTLWCRKTVRAGSRQNCSKSISGTRKHWYWRLSRCTSRASRPVR